MKLNYLSHILAQGKKEGAAALPYSPGPSTVSGNSSSNIQEVLIDNYSTNGKTVVSPASPIPIGPIGCRL